MTFFINIFKRTGFWGFGARGVRVVLEVGGDLLSPGEVALLHAFSGVGKDLCCRGRDACGCADCHYSYEVGPPVEGLLQE